MMPVTISVLFYYVSVRSEFRIVMPVTISVLFYYNTFETQNPLQTHVRTMCLCVLSSYCDANYEFLCCSIMCVRSEFNIVMPVTISCCSIMCLCVLSSVL